ncbi:MAG TPA: M24 family metallopeptidase [Pseudolabrys sp.]|nr:M24 family metallopeptidase [Pseudolabrys sp.]
MDHPTLQDPKIKAILEQPYGRFSDQEFARRRRALADAAAKHDCDAVLLCGEERTGTGVGWLTGWPTSARAFVVFKPGERDVLFVEHVNHVPNARQIARDADVRWAERRGAMAVAEELTRRGIKRVGVIGVLTWLHSRQLETFDLIDLSDDYRWLRMRKSDEEIDWMRIGAAFSDLGLASLLRDGRPGMTERELGALVEHGYHALGGSTVIHFIGRNDMANPTCCVPPQHHSTARLKIGDMMFVEFSGTFWDYPGQVLRTITVGAEPTPLFQKLYDTAEAAFHAITGVLKAGVSAQQIFDATALIEDAGLSIYDDIVHGFGGGYWPPVLGTKSRPAGPVPDMRLERNMTIVVQPNVITTDQKAGVQLGEMLRITETGFERLHATPWGFLRMA